MRGTIAACSLALALSLVAGCSPDAQPPAPGELLVSSGRYALSNAGFESDGCGLAGGASDYASFDEAAVSVHDLTLDLRLSPEVAVTYGIDGAMLDAASRNETVDFADAEVVAEFGLDRAYDCRVVLSAGFTGTITGLDSFTLRDEYGIDARGGECDAVATLAWGADTMAEALGVDALPCTSIGGADASR